MATSFTPVRPHGATAARAARSSAVALLRVATVLATAGGVIHLSVIRHHLGYELITAGFAVMGGAQLFFAAGMLIDSSRRLRVAGMTLHASIVTTWLLSRTVGLVVVPGAENRASFGFADTTANAFAIGVIVALVAVAHVEARPERAALSVRASRAAWLLMVLTAAVTVPAVLATHDHAGHDRPTGDGPAVPANGHAPGAGGSDDHGHDHG